MWECNYAKEPFDLRLTLLRLIKKSGVIILLTALGTAVFGGGYYLKNVALPTPMYGAKSSYYVEYKKDPRAEEGKEYTYINAAAWNDWVHMKAFLDLVSAHLPEAMSQEELAGYLSADLASNLRMPSSLVSTPDPELSLEIAGAVERSFEEFPELVDEIVAIKVVNPAVKADRILLDARPVRAFVLSGVLSLFFALVCCSLWEISCDGIWLPALLGRRFGLKVLGTAESPDLIENMRYLFDGKKRIAVCPASGDIDPEEVIGLLREKRGGERPAETVRGGGSGEAGKGTEWIPTPSPLLSPEVCERLRELDGILLAVKAGEHGRRLERTLEFLTQQDCRITAAILWEADEKLIRRYYFLPVEDKNRL